MYPTRGTTTFRVGAYTRSLHHAGISFAEYASGATIRVARESFQELLVRKSEGGIHYSEKSGRLD
jgi:hypothetical protein